MKRKHMALELTSTNFELEVTQSSKPVVIDVYAVWCGPCKQMLPIFEELNKEFGTQYKFVKLNIDEERDLAVQYNVSSIPTFVFVKDGHMVAKETGSMTKEMFKQKLKAHFD